MLRLICGDFGTGKTTKLYNMIREQVERKKPAYLLVPEQMTVKEEESALSILPPTAPLYFEVTNFSRLANTVFRVHGGLSYRYATAGTRALLMWRTLSDLSPYLKNGKDSPELGEVRRMLSAISELRAAAVTAEDLSSATRRTEAGKLHDTLADLSLIFPYYHEKLNEAYDDMLSDLDRLAALLPQSDLFRDAEIYIDSFTSFTEQQYRVTEELLAKCDLTVSIGIAKDHAAHLSYEEVAEFRRRLIGIAERVGVPCTEQWLTENHRFGAPTRRAVAEQLFAIDVRRANTPPTPDGSLSVVEGRDPFEAAEYVAADILRRVRAGARFCDFAILAADATVYAGILDAALEKSGIPVFMSNKVDVSSFEIVKLIFSAYAILQNDWRQNDILSYLKCHFSGLSRADIDRFETYVTRWQIRGKRYTDPRDFEMHPGGYSDRAMRPHEEEYLATVNTVKHRLVEQLNGIAPSAGKSVTVRTHAETLIRFLEGLDAERILLADAKTARAEGRAGDAACLERLYGILCDSLTRLVEALGDLTMPSQSFLDLLRLLFSEVNIGRIPSSADEVTVGSASELRADGVRHIYLFGVNEGEFPATVTAGGLFSEEERAILEELGLPFHPDLYRRASRELYVFARAFSAASESVTCVYTLAGASLDAGMPARVISRILEIGGIKPTLCANLSLQERVQSPAAALEAIPTATSEERASICRALYALPDFRARAEAASTPLIRPTERVSKRAMQDYHRGRLNLTQSRIESYVRCPFAYFCQYVLRLDEDRRARFDYANVGNFVHAVLENLFRSLADEGKRLSDLPLSDSIARLDGIVSAYISSIAHGVDFTPRLLRLIERLKRSTAAVVTSLYEELSQSEFIPAFFELPISEGKDSPTPLDLTLEDGTRICLYGTVDRVDVYRKGDRVYLRVIDYKTGAKSFSRADIPKGEGLQMPLYLFSLTESDAFAKTVGVPDGGALLPAGVLYLSTRAGEKHAATPSEEDIEERLREGIDRSGLLLEDEEILRAMDRELSGKFIPVKLKKDGSYHSDSAKSLIPAEEMDTLLSEIKGAILGIADGIADGVADAVPAKKGKTAACQNCKMKAVCRNVRT